MEETALQIGVEIAVPEERGEVGGLGADGSLGALRILVYGRVVPALHGGEAMASGRVGAEIF